jgi:hypothetical protein
MSVPAKKEQGKSKNVLKDTKTNLLQTSTSWSIHLRPSYQFRGRGNVMLSMMPTMVSGPIQWQSRPKQASHQVLDRAQFSGESLNHFQRARS